MRWKSISAGLLISFTAFATLAQTARAAPRFIPPGLDGRFAELARQVPGFGGYFFDEQGDLNVYLTDPSQEPAARAAVADVASRRPERSGRPWSRPAAVVVRLGDYDFLQLDGWRGRLGAAFTIPGVQFLDTDEAGNRVVVGVTSGEASAAVQGLAGRLGIPREAVVIEVVPPIEPIASLQDPVRPLVGGLQIDFGGSQCTLGANVWYTNHAQGIPVGTLGFLTAAHCSNTWRATDGTVYSQGGQQIGQERWDPPPFTNAQNTRCPAGARCRWSDVSFVAYDANVDRRQGAVAHTLYRGFGPWQTGSLDISSSSPHFLYVGMVNPVVGTYLEKVGRTTGWTVGSVSRTCADYTVLGRTVLCQDQVEAYAEGGDSGSPVFRMSSDSYASFAGIVWAKTGAGGFIFSNLDRIQADLGGAFTYGPN